MPKFLNHSPISQNKYEGIDYLEDDAVDDRGINDSWMGNEFEYL